MNFAKLRHQYGASYLAKTETNGFVSTLTLLSTNASLANLFAQTTQATHKERSLTPNTLGKVSVTAL